MLVLTVYSGVGNHVSLTWPTISDVNVGFGFGNSICPICCRLARFDPSPGILAGRAGAGTGPGLGRLPVALVAVVWYVGCITL